jgi:adenine specific DNA methylase Mod
MSHYLKVLMDAVFDPRNFRNEIVWLRTGAKSLWTRRLATNHDILLLWEIGPIHALVRAGGDGVFLL